MAPPLGRCWGRLCFVTVLKRSIESHAHEANPPLPWVLIIIIIMQSYCFTAFVAFPDLIMENTRYAEPVRCTRRGSPSAFHDSVFTVSYSRQRAGHSVHVAKYKSIIDICAEIDRWGSLYAYYYVLNKKIGWDWMCRFRC